MGKLELPFVLCGTLGLLWGLGLYFYRATRGLLRFHYSVGIIYVS